MSEINQARTWPIWLTLLLTLSGPLVYMAFMQNAWVRATGAPMFAVMAIGVLAGVAVAARNRKRWVRIVAGFNVLLLGLMIFGFFVAARLPGDPAFATLTAAPDFTLDDENGKPVSLADARAGGPVHLVFYRGHW